MHDFLAVQLEGALSIPKARVLYRDGEMRVYGKDGLVAQMAASKPKRMKGWRRKWSTVTDRGVITMQSKCIACGGWARMAAKSADKLWSDNAD